eukprot:gene24312-32749_t
MSSLKQKELTKKFKNVKVKLDEETMLPSEWVLLRGSTKLHPSCSCTKRSIYSSTAKFEKKIIHEAVGHSYVQPQQNVEVSFMRLHELVSSPCPNIEMIRMYLTTFPVNALNQRNESGDLPLHIALKKPEPESVMICELLNRFPASAKEKDSTGNLPLFLACRNQKTSYGVIRLLLNIYPQAAKCKVFGSYALHTLCYNGSPSPDIFRMLLAANPDAARIANFHGNLPLHYVCASSSVLTGANWDVIRMLLSRNREAVLALNKEAQTPLSRALGMLQSDLPPFSATFTQFLEFASTENGAGYMGIIRDLLNSVQSSTLDAFASHLRRELNWTARCVLMLCTARVNTTTTTTKPPHTDTHSAMVPRPMEKIFSLVNHCDVWRRIVLYL